MKQFEMAEIEVDKFAMEDVITTSTGADADFGGMGEDD